MRITKLETKLGSIPNDNYFLAGKGLNATLDSFPYQILATCRSAAAVNIEQLILTQLNDAVEPGYQLKITPRRHQPLVDFCVSLSCSTTERAALVRLVSRLGREPEIRSVRWQSVPGLRA